MEKKIEDLKYRAMWSNEDIQNSLRYLNDNPAEYKKMSDELNKINDRDSRAVMHCINEGWYEEFDRYDSDVAEQYIYWFRTIILNGGDIDCPDGVRRTYDDYRWYVRDLSRETRPLSPAEEDLVEKSGWADFWRNW